MATKIATEEKLGFAHLKKNRENGIRIERNQRTLWFRDQQIATGVLPGRIDPYTYFYELRFLDDFPEITEWAFGSAWTQQVMIEKPKASQGELLGKFFFASEDDQGIYIIEQGHEPAKKFTPIVQTPLPGLFNHPLNIPLRIVIAQMLIAALDDDMPYDQWIPVTSLVRRKDVADLFVTDMVSAYGFQIKALGNDLCQALCDLQNIQQGK